MQDTMQEIREIYPSLSSAKKAAASFFLNHFRSIPFSTVTELAESIGVSDTTIINLCVDLGFKGFATFKRAVKNEIQREQSILPQSRESSAPETEVFDPYTAEVTECIKQTLSDVQNRAAMDKTAVIMGAAERINIVGFWSNSGLAQDFALQLRRDGYRAQAIFPSFGDFIDKVLQIEKNEIVIMFDFSRYITALTEICVILKRKEVPILLVTDMGPCPRHAYADYVVHCRTESAGGGVGGSVARSVVGILLRLLRSKYPKRIREYDLVREGIFTRFNQYGVVEPGADYMNRV